jgi:hypothetical protein
MLNSVAGGRRRCGQLADLAGIALFGFFLLWLVARSVHSPHWNWDLVPYVACVLENRISVPAELHAATFEEIRQIVPSARFAALTSGEYFADVFRDPEALRQQLPLYRVKPAYIMLLRLLASTGLSPVTATLVVSIAASVSFAAFVFFWLRLHFVSAAAGPFAVLLSLLIGLPIVARISSPDALSGCCLLIALYALCEHAALGAASLAIVASVAIRSDNVIFGLLMAALFFARDGREDRFHPWRSAATALGVVVVYLLNVRAAGGYPWATFFAHSFAGALPRPAEWHGELSLPFYLATVARNAHMFLDAQPAAIALMGVVAFVQLPPANDLRSRLRRSLPPTVLSIAVIRYLLYSFLLSRHLFALYAALGVLFLTSNRELGRRLGSGTGEEGRLDDD